MILRRLFAPLNAIAEFDREALSGLRSGATNPLFRAFPALADRIPWRPLCQSPTPIESLPVDAGLARLHVKRDDQSHPGYGGNKPRKLEFFLAEAELSGRDTLITLGGVGSNHALATAIHGGALGFRTDLVLYTQPPGPHVRRNLGGLLAAGARLHYAGGTGQAFLEARRLFARRKSEGARPYFIMVGGSTRLGVLGHVSAALELAGQVRAGEIPEPDTIFVALGTAGTAAGLVGGLRLAGLRSRVVAVRVADPIVANARLVSYFATDALDFLRRADPSIPPIAFGPNDFRVDTGWYGKGYGHATAEGEAAIRDVDAGLSLETTYTGKALAACLDHCRRAKRPVNVLFWNTYSSAPVQTPVSWAELPARVHRFAMDDQLSP